MSQIMDLTLLLSFPGGWEWIIIILVIILLFGGKKIPELARGIGKGMREFNDAKEGIKKEIEEGARDTKTSNNVKKAETESNNV